MNPPSLGITRRSRGLSLLELLIAIALIGILLALGFVNIGRWRELSQIRTATTQVSQHLEQARTYSRRYSQDYRFKVATDNVSYAIEPIDSTKKVVTGTTAPPTIQGKIPGNIKFDPSATSLGVLDELIFYGPFGQKGASPSCFPLALEQSNFQPRGAIAVIGVMGKIYTRPVTYATTSPCS
jgi:type IV pilus assembly protein PilA